jgi:hypothetical protein
VIGGFRPPIGWSLHDLNSTAIMPAMIAVFYFPTSGRPLPALLNANQR